MTHFQLTLWTVTFSFRAQTVLLAGAAGIGGLLIMSAYVDTLQESVQRGEALRQLQRAGPTPAAAARGESARRKSLTPGLVALSRNER